MISQDISQPDHASDLAIIGGGLAGLTLSIGLSNHKIKHTIYESATRFEEIGAGISTGKNAIAALTLIDPRIIECYDRCATAPSPEREDLPFLSFRWGMAEKHRDGLECVYYR
jgi:salicylate hydroxylase